MGYADDLNLYAYVGNNPLNASDPTGLFCLIANSFCRRKERYEARARDPRLRDITVFAAAAATTLDTLDTPAFLTGFSPETTAFLEGVSAKLEVENGRIFNALIAGNSIPGITDAPDGIDRGIVRYEQGLVQGELDALRANDTDLYNTVVSEVNDAFAAWGGTSNAISAASRNLGHTPDFANRRDREQIGYETVRTEAAFSCARGDACNAGSLTGP